MNEILENKLNFSASKVTELLKLASKKTGIPEQDLISQVQNGSLDSILKSMNMNAESASKINSLLNNPKALAEFANSPKVKELIAKLNEGR